METFLARHQDKVSGTLNGFDRLRFRGTKRLLAAVRGMMDCMTHKNARGRRKIEWLVVRTKHG